MSRKRLVIVVLFALVLLTVALVPIASQQSGTYDPWIDLNDDGIIDVCDLQTLASLYGSSGTAINKTALLLDLLARVEALEGKFPVATDNIADAAVVTVKLADGSVTSAKILNGSILAEDLATGSVITAKIANGAVTTAQIADYAVTNKKLAASAIPYVYAAAYDSRSTTSTTWVDMPSMSVILFSISRASYMQIMFSAEANVNGVSGQVRALWDGNEAQPGPVIFDSSTVLEAHTYSFFASGVPAGDHIVKIQWMTGLLSTAYVGKRTLTVIALPA